VTLTPHGRYHAKIRAGGKSIHLGAFDDPIEAARAYDAALRRYGVTRGRVNGV